MSSYTHPSIPSDYNVKDAFSSTNAPNYTPTSPDYSRDFFPPEDISPPKDTKTPVESPILVSPSLSVGSSSPVRITMIPLPSDFLKPLYLETLSLILDHSLHYLSLEAQAATMANTNRNCVEEDKVTFATGTLTDDALSGGIAYAIPSRKEQQKDHLDRIEKGLLTNKYCLETVVKKMETNFYGLGSKRK
ncbi:hypothetical protein Tco_1105465 [Tanacetum coccineum]